ncbi:hypothetical protein PHMEG_00026798, partial [Phytophthora megakarya]
GTTPSSKEISLPRRYPRLKVFSMTCSAGLTFQARSFAVSAASLSFK